MKSRKLLLVLAAFMILCLYSFGLVSANPNRQGDDDFVPIPSPTLYAVDTAKYKVATVGGEDIPQVFERGVYGDFNVYETQIISNYPNGMEFSVTADSAGGDISSVFLRLTFVTGEDALFRAKNEDGVWIALPWKNTIGQPAWIPFEFQWLIYDEAGAEIETTPQHSVYWDYTQAWTRLEFDHFIVYIHNFERIYTVEELAQRLYEAFAATEPRRIVGFGGALSYKPIAVIYASEEEMNAIFGDEEFDDTIGGFAPETWGVTVQYFKSTIKGRALDSAETDDPVWAGCIWIDPEFNPALTADDSLSAAEASLNFAIYQTLPHEFTHLYQHEYGIRAPEWWIEGQAEYFTYSTGLLMPSDARLRYLITFDSTLPNLETRQIPRTEVMSDGCLYMVYNVGHSFLNWFVGIYGIETHAEIVRFQSEMGLPLFDAIELATDEEFSTIQNRWRAYMGFDLIPVAQDDPVAVLEDPINPIYAIGDELTLPPTPPTIPLFDTPGDRLARQSCFAYMRIKILRIRSLNGVNFYQIDCRGTLGWVAEDKLPPKAD